VLDWGQMKDNRDELMTADQPIRSRSYILRLWCVDGPPTADWHASLEDPSTKERFGFSNLEQLFAFLMETSERDSDGRTPVQSI